MFQNILITSADVFLANICCTRSENTHQPTDSAVLCRYDSLHTSNKIIPFRLQYLKKKVTTVITTVDVLLLKMKKLQKGMLKSSHFLSFVCSLMFVCWMKYVVQKSPNWCIQLQCIWSVFLHSLKWKYTTRMFIKRTIMQKGITHLFHCSVLIACYQQHHLGIWSMPTSTQIKTRRAKIYFPIQQMWVISSCDSNEFGVLCEQMSVSHLLYQH